MEQKQPAVVGPLHRHVGRLSPLNLRGLLQREVFDYSPSPEEAKKNKRERARYVSAYECPKCDELHRREDDAERCCQGDENATDADPESDGYKLLCPVCGSKNEDATDASDCCLWKDFDQQTRHAMARRIEDGSTWAAELGVWPPNDKGNRPA